MTDRTVSFVFKGNVANFDKAITEVKASLTEAEAASLRFTRSVKEGENSTLKVFIETTKKVEELKTAITELTKIKVDSTGTAAAKIAADVEHFVESVKSETKVVQEENAKVTKSYKEQAAAIAETNDARVASMKRADQQGVDSAREYAATITGIKQRQANETLRVYQDLEKNLRSIEERVAAGSITSRTGTLRSNKAITGAELASNTITDNATKYQRELTQYQSHQSAMLNSLQQHLAREAVVMRSGVNSVEAVRQEQAQRELELMRNLHAEEARLTAMVAQGTISAATAHGGLTTAVNATRSAITTSRTATQEQVTELQRLSTAADNARHSHSGLLTTIFEFAGAYRIANFAINSFLQGLRSIPQAGIEMQSTISALHASFSINPSDIGSPDNKQGEDLTAINMRMLQEEAQRTGIAITTLEKNYRSFLASAHLAGESTADINKIFQDLNTTITALHMSGDRAELTFLALSQMFNKGKIQSEELVKQLGNLLPGAFASFAAANHKSTERLITDMKAGAVSAHETVKNFIDFYAKNYIGAFEKASVGLNAELGRLETAWTNFSRAIFVVTQDLMTYFVDLGTTILENLTPKEETIAKWQLFQKQIKQMFSEDTGAGSMRSPAEQTDKQFTEIQRYGILLDKLKEKQLELQQVRGDFGKDTLTPFSKEWWTTSLDSGDAAQKQADKLRELSAEVTELARQYAAAGVQITETTNKMDNAGKNWDEVTTGAMAKLTSKIYHGVEEYNKIVTILSDTLAKQGGMFSVDTKDAEGNTVPAKGMTERFYSDAMLEANKLLFASMDKQEVKAGQINSKLEQQQEHYAQLVRSAQDLLREENDRVNLAQAQLSTSSESTVVSIAERRLALAAEYKGVLDQINLLKGVEAKQDEVSVQSMELLSEKSQAVKANLSAIATHPALVEQIRTGAIAKGLDPNLAVALAAQESKLNAAASSPTGAKGIMQLVSGTAAAMEVKNVWDAAQNIEGGLRYMKFVSDKVVDANDSVSEAMAKLVNAYHDGPGYKGQPHSAEGIAEVKTVLSTYAAMGGEVDKTALAVTGATVAYKANGNQMEVLIDRARKLQKAQADLDSQMSATADKQQKYTLPKGFSDTKAGISFDANTQLETNGAAAVGKLKSFLANAREEGQALTDQLNELVTEVGDAKIKLQNGLYASPQEATDLSAFIKQANEEILQKEALRTSLESAAIATRNATSKWEQEYIKAAANDTALASEIKNLDSQIRKASLDDKGQFLDTEREKLTQINEILLFKYGIHRDINAQMDILASKYDQLREAMIMKDLFNELKSGFATAISDMVNGTKSFSDTFKNLFDNAVNSILNSSIKRLQLGLENVWNGFEGGWSQVFSSVVAIGATALTKWLSKSNDVAPVNAATVAGKTYGSGAMFQADTGARQINYDYSVEPIRAWNQALNDAATLLHNNSEQITAFLSRVTTKLFGEAGMKYIGDLINSIKAPFEGIYNYVNKFGENLLSGGKDLLNKGIDTLVGVASTGIVAGFGALAGGSVSGAWSQGVGSLSTASGDLVTTTWNGGVNLASQSSGFAGSAQAAGQVGNQASQVGTGVSGAATAVAVFLSAIKLGFDLASIAGNSYLTTMEKVTASLKAAEGAVVAIPVVGWVAGAVLHFAASITQLIQGDIIGGLSYLFGGHLGELIAGLFKKAPSFTLLSYQKANEESTMDPSGQFFSSGGGRRESASIGVKTDFGFLDARVNDVGYITADRVKDSFLQLLQTTQAYDAQLGASIRNVDRLTGSKDTLAAFAAQGKQFEPEIALENLDSSKAISLRFTDYIGKGLENTGTIAGETAGVWIKAFASKILDPSKGENYNLAQVFNVESFVAELLPSFVKLPKSLAKLFTDNVKSISDGATQDQFVKQFTDFFAGWQIASKGLADMGTDIQNTAIPEYLASLTGLGFTVKDSAIQLVQYAEALRTAGGYTNDTLNAIITDLLDTVKGRGYSKDQVAGYTSTAITLSKTGQELGFKDSGNEVKGLADKLMLLTTNATASANAEIDKIITEEKLTNLTRQAAIEQLVLTGKLDETKVASADFSTELVKQTKIWLDAISTVTHFAKILDVVVTANDSFSGFVQASLDLIEGLGGLDKATERLSTTIRAAIGDTKYLYKEMLISKDAAKAIMDKNGATEATVDSMYLMALASKDLTAAQKAEIVSAYEVVTASRNAAQAYSDNVAPLSDLLTQFGLTSITGSTLDETILSLSDTFGTAGAAADTLKTAIDYAFSGNEQLQVTRDTAQIRFDNAASAAGLSGLQPETLRALDSWAVAAINDPNSGITINTKKDYNGVKISPRDVFKFVEQYGAPLQQATTAFLNANEDTARTPSDAAKQGSAISDAIHKDPTYVPNSSSDAAKQADDAAQKAADNAKKFADTMASINAELKNFNIAPLQKSFNDLTDKITEYNKAAQESGTSIPSNVLQDYRSAGTKQIVTEWAKPLQEAFDKLGQSDNFASVYDITNKYRELNTQLDIIYANTDRQYFTEQNLAEARIKLANLQQGEIDKLNKAVQESVDGYTAGNASAGRGSQVSSVLSILQDWEKQINSVANSSMNATDKTANMNAIIFAAQLKVQDVFKSDAQEYINSGKTKRDSSISEITTWFTNTKSVLREIALAYNITEAKALEVITTIRDNRLAALDKEREATVLTALNSYKTKGTADFPELASLTNGLTDLVTNATTTVVGLLNAGAKSADIITYIANTYRGGADIIKESLDSVQKSFDSFSSTVKTKGYAISDKILEMLNPNNTDIVYNAQRQRALAELQSSDLQTQLSAAETLFNLETQRYQVQITNEKALLDAAKNIKKWIEDFKVSQLSTISPEAKVAEAQKQYAATLSLAKNGDSTATTEITSKANTLIEALNAYYASSTTYQTSVETILNELGLLAAPAKNLTAGETLISDNTKQTVEQLRQLQAEYDKIVAKQTTILADKVDKLQDAAIKIETTFRASMIELASVYGISATQLTEAVNNSLNTPVQNLLARTLTSILSGLSIFDTLNVTLAQVGTNTVNLTNTLISLRNGSTVTSGTGASTLVNSISQTPTASGVAPWALSVTRPYAIASTTAEDPTAKTFYALVDAGKWIEAANYMFANGHTKGSIASHIAAYGGSYQQTIDWLTLQGYAEGGNYTGGVSIVGEKGPELFASKVGGRITSNADTSNMLKEGNREVVDAIKESIAITAYELRTLRSENSDKQGAIVAKLAMMERRLSQIEGNGALAGAS